MVFTTTGAEKVREASPQDSARHIGVQLVGHELRQRAPAGLVGPLLFKGEPSRGRASDRKGSRSQDPRQQSNGHYRQTGGQAPPQAGQGLAVA